MHNQKETILDYRDAESTLRFCIGDQVLFLKKINLLKVNIPLSSQNSDHYTLKNLIANDKSCSKKNILIKRFPVDKPPKKLQIINGYLCYQTHVYDHCVIDFKIGYESYLQKFSSKSRNTIKRKIKKFTHYCNGQIDFRTYKTQEELTEFHIITKQLVADSYQQRLFSAGLPDSEEFISNMLSEADKGNIRAYALFYENKPIAYLYLTIDNDKLIYKFLGYDSSYGQWSVGIILHWLVIEQLFAERRFSLLDFTEGENSLKKQFASDTKHCAEIYCFQVRPSNLLLIILHLSTDKFSNLLSNVTEWLGIKKQLRRFIRS